MSLLLEALKKAERAKEEAQRRAWGETGEEAAGAADPSAGKPVLARDKLPDIPPRLEIVSDDLSAPPAAPERPEPELVAEPPARPKAAAPRAPAPKAGDEQAAGRASAKKVFEAKFHEPNPRMPFYIAMGVLSVFAVGTIGYFWYQLRPAPALVNLNPPPRGEAPAVAGASRPRATGRPPPPAPGAVPRVSPPPRAAKPPPPAPPPPNPPAPPAPPA